jgi:UrcA family protein
LAGSPAFAHEANEPMKQITVTAPRTVTKTVGYSLIGAPIELTKVTSQVRYGDLNLSSYEDAMALKHRITDTAKSLCHELDTLHPFNPPGRDCVEDATAPAMKQADKAIAAAS